MSTLSTNLKRLRLLKGQTQGEFARELGVAQSAVSQMERGTRNVPDHIVQTIEFRYRPALGFLTEPIAYYDRGALRFRHAREGRAHVDQITTAFSITEHYLRKQYPNLTSNLPQLPIPDTTKPLSLATIEDLSLLTREHFGLAPDAPIMNLTTMLHQHGVLVTGLPEVIGEDSACDGVSSPNAHGVQVIALNRTRSGARYRFSLAHELAHLLLHSETTRTDNAAMETEANQFAGAFLMPRALLEGTIAEDMTLGDYRTLKQEWGYSMQAIIRRAHELGLLTYKRYRSLRMQISGRGWKINEPGTVLLENLHVSPINIFTPSPEAAPPGIADIIPLNRT